MANELITTTLVINFSAGDTGGILLAEVDDRPDGFNAGDTNFRPGSSPAFLLYKSSNVTIQQMVVTEGSLSALGSVTVEKSEDLQFAMEDTADFRYPYASGLVTDLIAPSGFSISASTGNTAKLNTKGVAIARVRYKTVAQAYRIVGASGNLPVLVYISGVAS